MALDPGSVLGHYEVLSPLGAGAMGEVYRAVDRRLLRDVALKVLPGEVASDPDRLKRFRLEAQALAALNHPSIVTVHSVEEAEGVHFLTMSLVEGQSLDRRLEELGESGMSVTEFFRVALEMVDGLAAAHERGIVHRDLKPANVMVTPAGRTVILDFGLAKFDGADATVDEETRSLLLTQAGTTMGTVPYMSPEQIEGGTVDARPDLFSIGIILYEMLSGVRPFQGASGPALMSSILRDTPRLLGEVRADVPASIGQAIALCLQKVPADRHASARALHAELGSLQSGEVSVVRAEEPAVVEADVASVAVLPFTDMSPQKDHDWFCEGMAEELINGLSGVEGLHVAARASAFQVKGQDIRQIGELLGVKSVLDGSVRTAGTRMRVTTQLNNTADGFQLWSKRYDRDMDDVFAVQDEISADIVDALQVELGGVATPSPAPRARHTDNVEAYHLYLKGRQQFFRRTPEAMRQSRELFEAALAEDPNYALALGGLADYYSLNGFYGLIPTLEGSTRSLEMADCALEIDDQLSEAHSASAFVRCFCFGRWEEAEAAARLSIELNPTSVVSLLWGAVILTMVRRFDEAIEWAERARLLDPLSPYASSMMSMCFLSRFLSEEALEHAEAALEMNPDYPVALYLGGGACMRLGENARGVQLLERAVEVVERLRSNLGWLGWAYGAAGRTEEAESVLGELESRSSSEWVSPTARAWVLSGLGRLDEAFPLLERSVEDRDPVVIGTPNFPPFDPLRQDPGSPALMTRARFPSGWL